MSGRVRPGRWATAHPALALFLFTVTLYALTAGASRNSFGYSADGTFAFEMAKSAVVDPGHAYLRDQNRNFSRWGVGLPLAMAPFVAFSEPIAQAAPQRDRIPLGEHNVLLVNFHPLGGAPQSKVTAELDLGLSPGVYDQLLLLSHTGLSAHLEQGTEVARLVLTDPQGRTTERPLRVGIETAEWAYDRADVRAVIQHERPPPAGKHIGDSRANYYATHWAFDPPIELAGARVEYLVDSGNLYVDGIAIRTPDGAWLDGPGVGRVWSERQNREFFRRLAAPFANVLISALGIVLTFQIVRRLGYARRTGLVVALTYALGTMVWPYAKFDFAEPLVASSLLASVWMVLLFRDTGLRRYVLLAGGAVLFAVMTKYVTIVVVPFLAAYVVASHKPGRSWAQTWRRTRLPALLLLMPFIVVLPVVLLAAGLLFDVRLLYERELIAGIQRGWLELPFALGFSGLITSWGKGLLWYNPILFVTLLGVPWFVRRHGWGALIFVVIPILYVLLYSKKQVWYGGNAWGPRYLVPILPFLIVMGAPLLTWLTERGRPFVFKLGLGAVLLVSVSVQVMGTSKDFGAYLDIFSQQVAGRLPENGAVYGGLDYQPWSSIQPEGDFAAVLYAPQFSPLLAHAWLLRADAANLLVPDHIELVEDALRRTPWSRFGIDAPPLRPENGLGLDFWSMKLFESFQAYPALAAWVGATLLTLQIVSLGAWAVLVRGLWPWLRPAVRLVPVGTYAAVLLIFDTLHFMV